MPKKVTRNVYRKVLFAPGKLGSTHSLWFLIEEGHPWPYRWRPVHIRIRREVSGLFIRMPRGRLFWVMARHLKRNVPGRVTIKSGTVCLKEDSVRA